MTASRGPPELRRMFMVNADVSKLRRPARFIWQATEIDRLLFTITDLARICEWHAHRLSEGMVILRYWGMTGGWPELC